MSGASPAQATIRRSRAVETPAASAKYQLTSRWEGPCTLFQAARRSRRNASAAIEARSATNVPMPSVRKVASAGFADTANGHTKVKKQAEADDAASIERSTRVRPVTGSSFVAACILGRLILARAKRRYAHSDDAHAG